LGNHPVHCRLGTKADKMAGLVDFDTAFQKEVGLVTLLSDSAQ